MNPEQSSLENPNHVENKIASLEQELNLLRSQMAERERSNPEIPSKDHAEKIISNLQEKREEKYEDTFITPEEKKDQVVLSLKPETHDSIMAELVEIVQKEGILNAIDIVMKMKNPHINDDFHRFIVEYLKAGYPAYTKINEDMIRPLRRVLVEILIPKKDLENQEEHINIYKMQNLIDGIQSFANTYDEYITLEISNPVGQNDFSIFASVHEDYLGIFEKQFLSIFPNGKLLPQKDDFNIFVPEGQSKIYSAQLKETGAKPIKTIETFKIDPLDIIFGTFTKMHKDEDGACLQFVIKPGKGFYSKNYTKGLEKIRKGERAEEIYLKDTKADRLIHGTGKVIGTLGSIFGGSSSKKEDSEVKIDQNMVDALSKKVENNIFSSNIRLVISSKNEAKINSLASEVKSAFDQFNNPLGNSFTWYEHEKDYKSEIKKFIYRQFNPSFDIPLNTLEIATLVHFPNEGKETASQAKRLDMSTAGMPHSMHGNTGVLLGTNEHAGESHEVRMSQEDRLRHMYVIGQTGTGKSSLLKKLIVQDIQNGEGVCMIDPHGSDIQQILAQIPPERIDDVIYFDPSNTERPMALNMLEYDERFPEQKTFVVNEMMSIFNKLFDMKTSGGPMFEQYFRNATMLVIDDPASGNTLMDVSRVLSDEAFREMKLSKCKNPTVVQFWRNIATKAGGEASLANIVPYITSKFDVFLSNDIMRPVVTQSKSSFNFREVMDNKKILLVNLSKGRLGDINSNLIGLIIVGKLLMASLSRVDLIGKDFPPFYLYIDEFQNITTDSVSSILSEARKYKLSLCIAHQFIAQLQEDIKDAVFGNVGTIAAFRVGHEDAQFLENQFSPRFTAKDIIGIQNLNYYIKMLNNGVPVDPFNVKLTPFEDLDMSKIEDIKELSFIKYGRPRGEIENSLT